MNENDVITLIHDRLDEPIEIRCGQPTALYVENADECYRLVGELLSQYSGGEGEFSVLRNGELTTVNSAFEIVSDIFAMELSDKKTVNSLYKELIAVAKDGDLLLLQSEINGKIAQFYQSLFAFVVSTEFESFVV